MDKFSPFLWDNHVYLPNRPGTRAIEQIERHRKAGFAVAFINLGDADRNLEAVIRMAAYCRRWLKDHSDRFILLRDVKDVERARREGKLAVGFNLEGLYSIGNQLDALSLLYDLGVRWALFVYNRKNLVGSGVHDKVDGGLTAFGRQVVTEMDQIGMIKCLSHTGHRTVMEILDATSLPCIFSHSNASAVWTHARNIPDDLIKACARGGGVVCVNGIDLFLGPRGADPVHMAEHIDHISQLVGVDHVGIGIDYGYEIAGEPGEPPTGPGFWPKGHGYGSSSATPAVSPEEIAKVFAVLEARGYRAADLAKIGGENMLRVAERVWRRSEGE